MSPRRLFVAAVPALAAVLALALVAPRPLATLRSPELHPAPQPTRTWAKPIEWQETPKGLRSLRARDCAVCHPQQAEQWSASAHANAWYDPQFQAEWKKDGEPRVCLNCHTPLANQQARLTGGSTTAELLRAAEASNPRA